jgi:A/G-specific adenine glycosylase
VNPKLFCQSLLKWYNKNHRDLPWRRTDDPYRILVSEIMLQQTQVQTVIPYYKRWVSTFPSFQVLAKMPLNKVLKAWEGLGYYSRARNLHALAKVVVQRHRGKLPSTFEELKALPGIGRYTAGAVLSIAFGKDYPVVDGNVMRVLARHFAIRKDITLPATQHELWELAGRLLPHGRAGTYNQALMELGATICTPKNPACPKCPVQSTCLARRQNIQNELPIKKKSGPTPHYTIGAGVVRHGDKILISQRPLNGLLGGLWEFPGGKKEPGESLKETVRREIQEELGIKVAVGKKLVEVDHAYSHFKITLHAHDCVYRSGKVQALGVRDWRWVRPQDLKRFAFPAANQPIIRKLLGKAQSVRAGGS